MKKIAFLTYRMSPGYGVDVVVNQLCKHLPSLGFNCQVFCLEQGGQWDNCNIKVIENSLTSLNGALDIYQPDFVIAHTSPFFEMLPLISDKYIKIAYEHGDPTPELFLSDREERVRIKENKIQNVYSKIDGVVAISNFIKSDISYPNSVIIPNGAYFSKDFSRKQFFDSTKPLKIGTLMRMGLGEKDYKGNDLVVELNKLLRSKDLKFELAVMGKGTLDDAQAFKKEGIITHLNATDVQKIDFLTNLDLFISFSLWEGFNLPVSEALCCGTLAFALDTGAHPEVTPFTFSSLDELASLIEQYASTPTLLLKHTDQGVSFHRRIYTWEKTASSLCKYLNSVEKNGALEGSLRKIMRKQMWCLSQIKTKLKHAQAEFKAKLKHAQALGIKGSYKKICTKIFSIEN